MQRACTDASQSQVLHFTSVICDCPDCGNTTDDLMLVATMIDMLLSFCMVSLAQRQLVVSFKRKTATVPACRR